MPARSSLLSAALAAAGLIPVAPVAQADSYWRAPTAPDGVDLYNVSTVQRTPQGFRIWHVIVADDLPRLYGPTAYRLAREDFDCGDDSYAINRLREYDGQGRLLDSMGRDDHGTMRVAPGTPSDTLTQRYCAGAAGPGDLPASDAFVEEPNLGSAYDYGSAVLAGRTPQ